MRKSIFIYLLVVLLLINIIKTQDSKPIKFRCGANEIQKPPADAKIPFPTNKNNSNNIKLFNLNTKLNEDEFKDFNIYLDLENFNVEVNTYNLGSKKQFFIDCFNKALKTIKSLLKVKPLSKNFQINDELLINNGINKWDKEKVGDEIIKKGEGMKTLGIDLYLFIKFGSSKDMSSNTTIASALAISQDPSSYQPLAGKITINKDWNFDKTNSLQYLSSILLHEITHVLGFSSYYFEKLKMYTSKTDKSGIKRFYINSKKLLNVAKKYYNCDNVEGIELEEYGGEGTAGSHWEERILLGEYMTGVVYNEDQAISEFTLAVLEDLGFYKANYYTGGLMRYGKNKGCDFLNSKCVNNGKINQKFTNEFFDINNNGMPACSSGRQSRAYQYLSTYDSIPKEYIYFDNPTYGGRSGADFCPVFEERPSESTTKYFVGHCSEIGSNDYGSYIANKNSNYTKKDNYQSVTGESYSENSFCALSSLIPENNNEYPPNIMRAICYPMFCSDKSLTIKINKDYVVCPRTGGKIKILNYNGYILCPDYNLICSGTVICNDMFDCVEKKSELKDIKYDYEIKTSQDLIEEEKNSFLENFCELSKNGKCPIKCIQCDESSKCLKYYDGDIPNPDNNDKDGDSNKKGNFFVNGFLPALIIAIVSVLLIILMVKIKMKKENFKDKNENFV